VWDLTTRSQAGEPLTGHTGSVNAVACTLLEGRPVAVTGGGGTVRVWDLTTRNQIGEPLTGHTDRVEAVACTLLEGRPVAVTAGDGGTVRVWDLGAQRQIAVLQMPDPADCLSVSPLGALVVAFGWDISILEPAKDDHDR
jgi:WD40 repeat protein